MSEGIRENCQTSGEGIKGQEEELLWMAIRDICL
jgi:hypothetical protein